jgi:predicted RNA methylase
MLATLATDEELAVLRGALSWLAANGPGAKAPAVVGQVLVAFGIAAIEGGAIVPRLRMRRVGGRFYVMALGLGDAEYVQDVWPETDVLVAEVARAARPGRVLDLGTGCGVVAIEAAARGHDVVATDVYEATLTLARFNARLNGVHVEFRQGHLFEAARGERFDLVVTNPHYGRVSDMLRLETLRAAGAHINDAGRAVVATVLEWDEPAAGAGAGAGATVASARRLAVEPLLEELARGGGLRIEVAPIVSDVKRDWFAVARGVPGAPSRHRFVVTMSRPPAGAASAPVSAASPAVTVTWPDVDALPRRDFVPLARLLRGGAGAGAWGATLDAGDVAALGAIARALAVAEARFDVLPRGLLDACRFGARPCVGVERGAAGAILDDAGRVRTCAHGGVVGAANDTRDDVAARIAALGREAEARRGCATCAARDVCSRCLFPFAVDEAAYCDFVRAHARELPLLHRLFDTIERLDETGVPDGPLALTRWPAARDAPFTGETPAGARDAVLVERDAWLVERGGRRMLFWRAPDGALRSAAAPAGADLAALVR